MAKFKADDIKQIIKESIREYKKSMLLEAPKEPFRRYDGRRSSPQFLDEKSIKKNKFPFKAIFVLGPAGAGKTFISKQVGIPKDFVVSNPDQRIESVFPAFGVTMEFANSEEGGDAELEQLQQKMRKILQNASQGHTANLLQIANPIIFDTTGEDVKKISKRMIELTRIGYDVGVLQINVPTDVSVDRDQGRDRTVGASRTSEISSKYQEQVVKERGYLKELAGVEYATVFGGDIYPNLYDLRDGSLLPGITADHVKAMGGFTPKKAEQLLTKMRGDVANFLTGGNAGPENPTGSTILQGMKDLVALSKGKLGQNMVDVELATTRQFQEEYPNAPESILAAAKLLARLGGAEAQLAKTQRKHKGDDGSTIRGMTGNDRDAESDKARGDDKDGGKRKFEEEIYNIVRDSLLKR